VGKVKEGLDNLKIHIENIKKFSSNMIVVLNKYSTDTVEEINVVKNYCEENNIMFELSTAYTDGGEGALALANKTLEVLEKENNFNYIYNEEDSIKEKIEKVSKEIYRAEKVEYEEKAEEVIKYLEEKNVSNLPICIAKTQYSLSDDPKKLGGGYKHTIHVKNVKLYNGAGFIVIFLGDIIAMPGLPKKPNYLNIDIKNNEIIGLS